MTRVLIVEDDKITRKGLITTMPWEAHGMEVVGEAANGALALVFLAKHEVDLCFVDLMMPVMGGLEFIRRAKAQHPLLAFVIITFHEEFDAVREGLRLGVLDYISKLEFEQADLDGILKRITLKLSDFGGIPKGSAPEAGWLAEFRGRKWLYDRFALETLLEKMCEEPLPMAAMERLFVQVLHPLQADAGLKEFPLPAMQNLDHAARYLRALREQALQQADACVDACSLIVCLLKAVAMAERDFGRDLHTEEVAASVGLSRPYFSQCFSREAGVPFNAYLRRVRIDKACGLLLDSGVSVQDAALKVGYEDPRYFYRIFCELTGQTPGEYKKNHS